MLFPRQRVRYRGQADPDGDPGERASPSLWRLGNERVHDAGALIDELPAGEPDFAASDFRSHHSEPPRIDALRADVAQEEIVSRQALDRLANWCHRFSVDAADFLALGECQAGLMKHEVV